MIRYRTFLNTDSPALLDVWNGAFQGRSRGAAVIGSTSTLEQYLLGKPYFDPAGLIIAEETGHVLGFALAGFGPNEDQTGLNFSTGVLCAIVVRETCRRQGIGSELLRRAEVYMAERGAKGLCAGPMPPLNPFTFGIYGGSDSPGFLESDPDAGPFLQHRGYAVSHTTRVLQRRLDSPVTVADARFAGLRKRFDFRGRPRAGVETWWRECIIGPVEAMEFYLEEKVTGKVMARARAWEMDPFASTWNEASQGLLDLHVLPEVQRQGLAKLLLLNMFRFLQDQFFSLIEVQVRDGDEPALNLFKGVGFEMVDTGHQYRKG